MKLNAQAFGIAFAGTATVIWVLCFLLTLAVPGQMMNMTGTMMHADMGQMSWSMSGVGFISGLIIWVVLSAATGWLIATIYNRFAG